MSDARTKQRILDAAERLFGERGFAGTSMRAITSEAGVNLAAANYHFGSKESLLRAAFDRLAEPVNRERLEALDRLLETSGERPPLAGIVSAFLSPALRVTGGTDEHAAVVRRFLARVASDPSPEVRTVVGDEFATVSRRFLDALGRAMPELSAEEVAWRFNLLVGVLVRAQSAGAWPAPGGSEADGDRRSAWTSAFALGGLSAGTNGRS